MNENDSTSLKRLNAYTWFGLLLWSACIVASLYWNIKHLHESTLDMALASARISYQKDIVFRHWNSENGGVYIPITEENSPNPYLNVAERDIETPFGMKLTLMNPAYMTRKVHQLAKKKYGLYAHITSLNPIRPENAPDDWETKALKAFESGKKEIYSLETLDGKPYLRLMKPLITETECLKCHQEHGYKVGDIHGGIGVSIPMQPLWDIEKSSLSTLKMAHLFILIAGIFGILRFTNTLKHQIQNRNATTINLKLANETLEKIFETTHFCIVYLDRNFNFIRVNNAYAQACGHDIEYFKGKNHFALYPHEENEAIFRNVIATGTAFTIYAKPFIFENQPEKGTTYWNWTLHPIKDEQGRVNSLIFILVDVTETQLKCDARYRELVEETNDLIIRINAAGKIEFVNHMAQKYFGITPQACIDKKIEEFIYPLDVESTKAVLNEAVNSRISSLLHENRLTNTSGNVYHIAWTINLYFDDNGDFTGGNGIGRDITAQKKMQEELIKSKKLEATGVLAGGIAHDFNNLLHIILGNLDLLKAEINSKNYFLLEAQRALLRARDLTQKFVTFSSGGDPVTRIHSVNKVIAEVKDIVLSGTNIRSDFFPDKELLPARIDKSQIHQALANLLTNAKEAMPGGGVITITTKNITPAEAAGIFDTELPEGQYIEIVISDQGRGIYSKNIEKIFDPYFSTKERGTQGGMGMGLAITHSIIKKHNGFIRVTSLLDKGTNVYIYLPASEDADEPRIEKEIKPTALSTAKRILLMDDEEQIRMMSTLILEQLGYKTKTASHGKEAVELYQTANDISQPFDLVILDLTVKGGMGGIETMAALRKIDPEVKAIIISGYSSDPVLANFKEYGFIKALIKPILKVQLKSVLDELFTNNQTVEDHSLNNSNAPKTP